MLRTIDKSCCTRLCSGIFEVTACTRRLVKSSVRNLSAHAACCSCFRANNAVYVVLRSHRWDEICWRFWKRGWEAGQHEIVAQRMGVRPPWFCIVRFNPARRCKYFFFNSHTNLCTQVGMFSSRSVTKPYLRRGRDAMILSFFVLPLGVGRRSISFVASSSLRLFLIDRSYLRSFLPFSPQILHHLDKSSSFVIKIHTVNLELLVVHHSHKGIPFRTNGSEVYLSLFHGNL